MRVTLTRMVKQVEHRECILVRAKDVPYVQCEIGGLYCLAPKVLVVGVYKRVAREG